MQLTVIKKADDWTLGEKVLRISIGGPTDGSGAYVTYRGDLDEIQKMLTAVVREFAKLQVEPPISPAEGKRYA